MIDQEVCLGRPTHCMHSWSWSHGRCCRCGRVWYADGVAFITLPRERMLTSGMLRAKHGEMEVADAHQ